MSSATWRERLTALADALRAHPRVEVRAFNLFAPSGAALDGLPADAAAFFAETDGLQLAWSDRLDADFDPMAEAFDDGPAPWDAAWEASWQGVLWIPPAARLRAGTPLDPGLPGTLWTGAAVQLPDGQVVPFGQWLERLLAQWGAVAQRTTRGEAAAPFAADVDQVRAFYLNLSVREVRRVATEDALWTWADRGLDSAQVLGRWSEGSAAPTEVVEVEIEADQLPAALRPSVGDPAVVAQLLAPWGSPTACVSAVELGGRPTWFVAFPVAPESVVDDETSEAADATEDTDDTDLAPVVALATEPPPVDVDGERDGLQYRAVVRVPGPGWSPRVAPTPVALRPRWTRRVHPGGRTYGLTASPDSEELASIAESGELRLWRASSGDEVPLEVQRELESYSEVGFGADGRLAVWDGNLVVRWEPDGSAAGFVHQPMAGVEGFDVDREEFAIWSNRPVFLDIRGDHHGTMDAVDDDPVSRSSLSPTGQALLVGTEGGQIAYFDLDPLERRWAVHTDLGEIRAVACLAGQARMAVGGREAVALYDADGGEQRRIPAHEGDVVALAWVGGGQFLVSAGTDRAVRVWCARSGALIAERFLPSAPVALVSPPSGAWLAVASANRLSLFDVALGG